MINEQLQVQAFMQGVGQHAPDRPFIPEPKTRRLRVGLIIEEALELALATGVYVEVKSPAGPNEQQHATITDRPDAISEHNLSSSFAADAREQMLIGAGDAFADLLYVVYGGAVAYGLDMDPLFAEVQRSNMTKLIDGHPDPVTGKWIKGPKYSPANLAPIIIAQINGTPVPAQVAEKVPLLQQLQDLINCNSVENDSDTPDFILASYLEGCLKIFAETVRAREAWYGRAKQALGVAEGLAALAEPAR